MSQHESPSGVSPATSEGRMIEAAGQLGGAPGWRGRAGRGIAYVALIGAAVGVVALVVGIVVWTA